MVTVNCPLTMVVAEELVLQTADAARFVVNCRVNPGALVGQANTTFVPDREIINVGGVTLVNDKLNIVPYGSGVPPV